MERRGHGPSWPDGRTERHWHTYGIGGLLVIISLMGWFLVDTLQVVRDDIREVKSVVQSTSERLIEVEKKLVAVVVDEALLRRQYEAHAEAERLR